MRSDDEQLNEIEDLRERLAGATELLERAESVAMAVLKARKGPRRELHDNADVLATDIRTFLANAPAAPTRTEHERAVLEACKNAHIDADTKSTGYDGPVMTLVDEYAVCRAVLAWREAGDSSTRIHDAERAVLAAAEVWADSSEDDWDVQKSLHDAVTALRGVR
jgi:hypothetical protein